MTRILDASGNPMRSSMARPAPRRASDFSMPPAQMMGGAYRAADATAWENGWNPMGSSADRELARELPTILERSNEAFRNDPLAQGIGWAFRLLTVGGGRTPRPQIDLGDAKINREVQRRIRRDFMLWSRTAGADGVTPLSEIQEEFSDSLVMGGASLALWPRASQTRYPNLPTLRVGLIDIRRMATPNLSEGGLDKNGNSVSLGVATNLKREVQGYWIKRERLDGTSFGDFSYYPLYIGPRVISRMFNRPGPKRPGQSRQPPLLTAALSLMYLLRSLLNAEMRGDIALTRLLGAITSQDPKAITEMLGAYNEMLRNESIDPAVLQAMGDLTSRSYASVDDAQIMNLMSGEKPEWFNAANRSNPSLGKLFELGMSVVSSTTGLPRDLCWLLFDGINFSNARTIIQQGKMAAIPWAGRHDAFNDLTYSQWLWEYWALGNLPEIRRGIEPHHELVTWQTDESPYLDPAKEASANDLAVKSGQYSMPDIIGGRNGDWIETIDEQIAYELYEKEKYEAAGLPWPPYRRTDQSAAAANLANSASPDSTDP
jgi:capsid protein